MKEKKKSHRGRTQIQPVQHVPKPSIPNHQTQNSEPQIIKSSTYVRDKTKANEGMLFM